MLQLHKSQDNIFVTECYAKFLGEIGGEKAHHLLHTSYQSRRRITDEVSSADAVARCRTRVKVSVCLGTNCYLKGSQEVLNGVLRHAEQSGLEGPPRCSRRLLFREVRMWSNGNDRRPACS